MFRYDSIIKMHNIDAAGRLFFADQFVFAHDAWEACLDSLDYSLGALLARGEFAFPVVHAEADYAAPVVLGDRIRIDVGCERIGSKSFTIAFLISKEDETLIGRVTHIHAAVSVSTGKSIPLPEELTDVLQRMAATE
ncbi:MAG: acyl-CoA thioesterase [Lentisphaerae bacterium]|nr:acyl-CoA thioesterase [Lentisphaerota bacterium]